MSQWTTDHEIDSFRLTLGPDTHCSISGTRAFGLGQLWLVGSAFTHCNQVSTIGKANCAPPAPAQLPSLGGTTLRRQSDGVLTARR